MSDKITHIGQLKFDKRNPRKHNPRNIGVIVNSLQQVGPARSIVIDEDDSILAGNGVTEAAAIAGIEKVIEVEADGDAIIAVRRRGLTEEQKVKLKYFDNRASDLAGWDIETILADIEAGVKLDDLFNQDELGALLEEAGNELLKGAGGKDEPPQVTETEAERLAKEYGVQVGDVWQLGRHKIACCDSLNEAMVSELIGGDKVGMVWADPPYGMDLDTDYSSMPSSANEPSWKGGKSWSRVIGDGGDFDPRFYFALFNNVAEQIWWGADYYLDRLQDKNLGSWLVWDKRLDENLDRMFGSAFELAWSKSRHKRDIIRVKWAGVFGTEKEDTRGRVHPTQKPVALARWCFEKYGQANDLIFDPFLGSGISILAAEQLNDSRRVIGMELAPEYIAVTIWRWQQLTSQQPTRLTG